MTDWQRLLARHDIDVVDIVTRGDHQDLVFHGSRRGSTAWWRSRSATTIGTSGGRTELAESKGLKTKVGLTFRYAPAVMYMFDLIREGFIGKPFVFNGYEQNSPVAGPGQPDGQADPQDRSRSARRPGAPT